MTGDNSCVCGDDITNLDNYNVPENDFFRWDGENFALTILCLLFEVIPNYCGYRTSDRGKPSENLFGLPLLCDILIFCFMKSGMTYEYTLR
jgi:hypothetical protein